MANVWKEQIKDNQKTIRKLKKTKFVHIPTRIFFSNLADQDPTKFRRSLRLMVQKRRDTALISDLIDWGIITKEQADIRYIIANYARRKGRDIALLRVFKAAKKEGLVTLGEKPNFTQLHIQKFPMFKGYQVHPAFAEWLYEYLEGIGRGQTRTERVLSTIKGFQFHNPFFLGMYDIIQSAMLSQGRALRPKYLKKGLMSAVKKDSDYWEALDNYIASKPFKSPHESWEQMVENAKNPWTTRALRMMDPRRVAHPVAGLKDVYSLSWNTAWWLDKMIRNISYQYLLDKGFVPREAAQIAALYHSDYADVPPKLRRMLNKICFTPTFKITMAKAYAEMITSASKWGTMKEFVKGKHTRATVAAKSLATMLAINQGFDMYMQSQGFGRDQYGRRYTKVVDTDEGDREIVVTFSHPANLPLKYLWRLMDAMKPSGDSFFKSFYTSNKYEIHPLWRVFIIDAITNRRPDGEMIYNPAKDSDFTKVRKFLSYSGKQIVRWAGVLEPERGEKDVRQAMYKEFGKITTWMIKPFAFAYLRKVKDERDRARIQSLIDTAKGFGKGREPITDEEFETLLENIEEIRGEEE